MGASSLALLLGAAIASGSGPAGDTDCLRALVPLAAESLPATKEFTAAPCPSEVTPAFRYDRAAGATRLFRPLIAGDIVQRFPEYGRSGVVPGQVLSLVVARGTVQVERQVVALQAAQSGERLFVRSDDGQIFSVRFEQRPR